MAEAAKSRRADKVILYLSFCLIVYIFTAPFALPIVYKGRVGKFVYAPIILSIKKPWFGRPVAMWYFYKMCNMDLMFPIEPDPDTP
jgi:hypothetical protein